MATSLPRLHDPAVADCLPPEPVLRLTVEQYHEMVRTGILDEDAPVELLDGWLITKMNKKPPHCAATDVIRDVLAGTLPEGWHTSTQRPITLANSEPGPDVAILRGKATDFGRRHPVPAEVGLVVEVADSSVARDRGLKLRVYAQAGLPVYWIVSLPEDRIEVYSDPSGPAKDPTYRRRQDFGMADEIPVVLEGRMIGVIAVSSLLPSGE